MNKVVQMMANRFLINLYKCKKVGEMGIQRLQLDLVELKTTILDIAKSESTVSLSSFNAFVKTSIEKIENILKLLSFKPDQFAENFKNFFKDPSAVDIDKILAMKGLKRNDIPNLTKILPLK